MLETALGNLWGALPSLRAVPPAGPPCDPPIVQGRLHIVQTTELIVHNMTTGAKIPAGWLPKIMQEVLEAGGPVAYLRRRRQFQT